MMRGTAAAAIPGTADWARCCVLGAACWVLRAGTARRRGATESGQRGGRAGSSRRRLGLCIIYYHSLLQRRLAPTTHSHSHSHSHTARHAPTSSRPARGRCALRSSVGAPVECVQSALDGRPRPPRTPCQARLGPRRWPRAGTVRSTQPSALSRPLQLVLRPRRRRALL